MVLEGSERFTIVSINGYRQKTASDFEVFVHVRAVLFAETRCVLVGRGATGELLDTGLGINGDILPMTITANDIHVFL